MSTAPGSIRRFLGRFAHRGQPGSYDGPHADDPWRVPTHRGSYGQGPRHYSPRTHGDIAGSGHRVQDSRNGWFR